MKVLSLLKKILFSVVLLYNLPGASVFLNRLANTKTFFPISKRSLSRFSVYRLLIKPFPSISIFFNFYQTMKIINLLKVFPVLGLSACSSIYSGKYLYFPDLVLFKLNVAFLLARLV